MKSKTKPPVTIEMVAREAGVSASTISRILNGTAVVSEEKRLAVEAAIEKLEFVPNPIARGLAGGRTMSIGVITQAIDSPFYGVALRGIEAALDPLGYSPLFVSGHWNAFSESRCVDVLLARRVDGIIVLTGRLPDAALRSCAKRVPIVVTGRTLKAANLHSLNFDNFGGAVLATEHLIQLGHRRIAFIAGEADHPDAVQRLRGYQHALQTAGIEFRPELVATGRYDELSGLEVTRTLFDAGHKFTAVFATNDQMAIGAAHAIQTRSLKVPLDVSVVGFDDLPTSAFAQPPLTTIRQSAYETGALAARTMLQLLSGEKPYAELPSPELIVRGSTAKARSSI